VARGGLGRGRPQRERSGRREEEGEERSIQRDVGHSRGHLGASARPHRANEERGREEGAARGGKTPQRERGEAEGYT